MEIRKGKSWVCVCAFGCVFVCMHMQVCNVRYREGKSCLSAFDCMFLCIHMQCCIVRDGKGSCRKTRDLFDLQNIVMLPKSLLAVEVVLMKVHGFCFACA